MDVEVLAGQVQVLTGGSQVPQLKGPPTARLPLPPTAETIVLALFGVRKPSQASALLLGLPPQPKADRQPPRRAASPSGPTQCMN